jgi:hypothetical protein
LKFCFHHPEEGARSASLPNGLIIIIYTRFLPFGFKGIYHSKSMLCSGSSWFFPRFKLSERLSWQAEPEFSAGCKAIRSVAAETSGSG